MHWCGCNTCAVPKLTSFNWDTDSTKWMCCNVLLCFCSEGSLFIQLWRYCISNNHVQVCISALLNAKYINCDEIFLTVNQTEFYLSWHTAYSYRRSNTVRVVQLKLIWCDEVAMVIYFSSDSVRVQERTLMDCHSDNEWSLWIGGDITF